MAGTVGQQNIEQKKNVHWSHRKSKRKRKKTKKKRSKANFTGFLASRHLPGPNTSGQYPAMAAHLFYCKNLPLKDTLSTGGTS